MRICARHYLKSWNRKLIKNETKIRMIIELGQEDGLSDTAIIERIEKKTGVSYEKAEAYIEEYGKQPV